MGILLSLARPDERLAQDQLSSQALVSIGFTAPMNPLYPGVEPHDEGMLNVDNGNLVYWEVVGNPAGKAAVVFHGGPGSGCVAGWRRYFNPTAYRVVLFDQRGCGRSIPHASDPAVDLATNTTDHLLTDIERLRQHLGIDRWLVLGGSWGSTLALAYAERFLERVSEMVLFSVVTTSRLEVQWVTRDVGRYFPEQWSRFCNGVPMAEREEDLVSANYRLLHDIDPVVREKAARDWCRWEDAHVAVRSDHRPDPRYEDPRFRLAFARIVCHLLASCGLPRARRPAPECRPAGSHPRHSCTRSAGPQLTPRHSMETTSDVAGKRIDRDRRSRPRRGRAWYP